MYIILSLFSSKKHSTWYMDPRIPFMFVLLQVVAFSSADRGMRLDVYLKPHLISLRIQRDPVK